MGLWWWQRWRAQVYKDWEEKGWNSHFGKWRSEHTYMINVECIHIYYVSHIVHCCSVAKIYLTLCNPMDCSMPGFPVLHYLPEFAHIHVHWVDDAIWPSPSLLPSIFPSIRVFSSELPLCSRWSKYWSFRISPSNEHTGLISFRIDWFDLAVQGTLKSLLQHHSSKASVLQCSAFFIFQLSHPKMTTGKTIP